jgi:6-pyruvoyltetrahydropterin/6-carboxytetrahydropterin synthase
VLFLSRTVRFAVNDAPDSPADIDASPNGYAGKPAMRGLGRWYQIEIACRGEASPHTGYFLDIKAIDAATRSTVIPIISHACRNTPSAQPVEVMRDFLPGLADALGGVLHSARWSLSPTYSIEMSPNQMTTAILRQRYEFAASHRLHVPTLAEEENRRLFGKCTLPSGHGHNYVVEPAVEIPLDTARPFSLNDLERITDELVIERFDHKHLNVDTEEFGDDAMNPSVENIARVCFDLLRGPIAKSHATLRSVTVWETEKTSATYPAS